MKKDSFNTLRVVGDLKDGDEVFIDDETNTIRRKPSRIDTIYLNIYDRDDTPEIRGISAPYFSQLEAAAHAMECAKEKGVKFVRCGENQKLISFHDIQIAFNKALSSASDHAGWTTREVAKQALSFIGLGEPK